MCDLTTLCVCVYLCLLLHPTGVGEPPAQEPLHRGGTVSRSAQVPGEVQNVRTHQRSLRPLQLPVLAPTHGQFHASGDHW